MGDTRVLSKKPIRPHIWENLTTIFASTSKALAHQLTSAEDLDNLFYSRKEVPGFLMLNCEIKDVCFHPNDPRIEKFFRIFGSTLIQLQINNSIISNDVLQEYFKNQGQILGSLILRNYHSIQGYYLRFPAISNGVPVVLPKLGVLVLEGSTSEFHPRLEEIAHACPNLIELHIDTRVDARMPQDQNELSFKKLELLEIRATSPCPISEVHMDSLERMQLKRLKGLFLHGVSLSISEGRLNMILESFGDTLEQLSLRMANDAAPTSRSLSLSSRNHTISRRVVKGRNYGTPSTRYYPPTHFRSAFPIRLPKLKALITDVNFQHESKLFKVLPLLQKFTCLGTFESITHGVFPTVRTFELQHCNDSLLFDICRSFPNLEELIITDGSSITDFGIVGNEVDFGWVEVNDGRYVNQCMAFDAINISTLTNLKKFWAPLSKSITDLAVFHGFAKCSMLEQLNLSGSAITTGSLDTIKKNLVSLKELNIQNCSNVSYLEMLQIFYKNAERKIAVRWS